MIVVLNSPPPRTKELTDPEQRDAEHLVHGQRYSRLLLALVVAVMLIQVLTVLVGHLLEAVLWWDTLVAALDALRRAVLRKKAVIPRGAPDEGGDVALEAWRHVRAKKFANRWLGKTLGRGLRGWHRHGPLTPEERETMHAWYVEGAARREQYGRDADGAALRWVRGLDGPATRLARTGTGVLGRERREAALAGELGLDGRGGGDVEDRVPKRSSRSWITLTNGRLRALSMRASERAPSSVAVARGLASFVGRVASTVARPSQVHVLPHMDYGDGDEGARWSLRGGPGPAAGPGPQPAEIQAGDRVGRGEDGEEEEAVSRDRSRGRVLRGRGDSNAALLGGEEYVSADSQ